MQRTKHFVTKTDLTVNNIVITSSSSCTDAARRSPSATLAIIVVNTILDFKNYYKHMHNKNYLIWTQKQFLCANVDVEFIHTKPDAYYGTKLK